MVRRIVLASSSPYRRQLLERLQLPFLTEVPAVDEAARPGEAQVQTALRLALVKAQACAPRHPQALIIGADQVAELDGQSIGKPGSRDAARRQLQAMRGRSVVFHSALALLDAANGRYSVHSVPTTVEFRPLSDQAIEDYLQREAAYDCAGSAKIEALGICLVQSVQSQDPTALIGLPLILLTTLLGEFGMPLPLPGAP